MGSGMWFGNLINLFIGDIIVYIWFILSPICGLFGLWSLVNSSVLSAVLGAVPSKVNTKFISGNLKLPK